MDNDNTGPHGFTADIEVNDDGAEVDDDMMHEEEELKSEEPDDGEDLDERIDDDYREMPELDQYEDAGIDHQDYDAMQVD